MGSAAFDNARRIGPSLLDMPCEVRMHIYHFLFEDSQIRIHFYAWVDSITAMLSPGCNRLHNIDLDGVPLSITQSCRLLRIESQPVLQRATTLQLCSQCNCSLTDPDPKDFLLSLAEDALQHIRKLSVDWYLLEEVQLHSFHELEVLKVTQVRCASDEENFSIEEALEFNDEQAVCAIKDSNQEKYSSWLAPPLGHTFRKYQMLCEGLIIEEDREVAGSGPSLYLLFDMDSDVVLARQVIQAQFIESGCQRCHDDQSRD